MKNKVFCPICQLPSMELFTTCEAWFEAAKRLKDEPFEVLKKIQHIPKAVFEKFLQCRKCKLIHSFPLPNKTTIIKYYQDASSNINYDLRVERSIKRAKKNINVLKKFQIGNRFIDVGCGVGGAAYVASQAGFNAIGIDLDGSALNQAQGRFPNCKFMFSSIEQFSQNQQFDLVYASEIIEHVLDINLFVQALIKLTKQNGYLFLTTPKVVRKMLSNPQVFVEWNLVGPPEHLFYFTQHNISKLLQQHGFRIVKFFSPLNSSLRVLAQKII